MSLCKLFNQFLVVRQLCSVHTFTVSHNSFWMLKLSVHSPVCGVKVFDSAERSGFVNPYFVPNILSALLFS